MLLEQISTEFVYKLLLLITRVSSGIMFMPALGERYLVDRAKLGLAFFISLLIYPSIAHSIPMFDNTIATFASNIAIEFIIGAMLGLNVRIILQCLSVLGNIVAMQSGLSAANFFDPVDNVQSPIFNNFLLLFCVVMIFATDTHHTFILALIESYQKFQPTIMPSTAGMSELITANVSYSFMLAFRFAAPFIVVGVATMVASGILSRLMPSLQIFFVLTPMQIWISFTLFALLALHIISSLTTILANTANSLVL